MGFSREYSCSLCGSVTRIEFEGGRESCSACRDVGSLVQFLQKRNDLLRQHIEELEREVGRLRTRAYQATHTTPGAHSTACITWGDDGRGNLRDGGRVQAGACSCGAWPAWITRERDEARAEVKRSHDAILHLTAEVARLEGLVLDYEEYKPGIAESRRLREQVERLTRERDEARAKLVKVVSILRRGVPDQINGAVIEQALAAAKGREP